MGKTTALFYFVCLLLPIHMLHALRVPDVKRMPTEAPPPEPAQLPQQVQGVDFPSHWDPKQFLARNSFGYEYNGSKHWGNQWWFQTVQPFYITKETDSNTLFVQFRAMFEDNVDTFNIGLGYRNLFYHNLYMLGINVFYDVENQNNIERWSIGGDFHTQWLTLAGNFYGNSGGWRRISRNGDQINWSRVTLGGDLAASAPFPYLPWLRAEAGFYLFNYAGYHALSAIGYTIGLEANIWGPLVISGGREADRYRQNNFVELSFNIGFPNFVLYTLWDTPVDLSIFPPRTLKRFILDPIQRMNRIRLQQQTTNS